MKVNFICWEQQHDGGLLSPNYHKLVTKKEEIFKSKLEIWNNKPHSCSSALIDGQKVYLDYREDFLSEKEEEEINEKEETEEEKEKNIYEKYFELLGDHRKKGIEQKNAQDIQLGTTTVINHFHTEEKKIVISKIILSKSKKTIKKIIDKEGKSYDDMDSFFQKI